MSVSLLAMVKSYQGMELQSYHIYSHQFFWPNGLAEQNVLH